LTINNNKNNNNNRSRRERNDWENSSFSCKKWTKFWKDASWKTKG